MQVGKDGIRLGSYWQKPNPLYWLNTTSFVNMILGSSTIFGGAGQPRLEGSLPGAESPSHTTALPEQNHSCF